MVLRAAILRHLKVQAPPRALYHPRSLPSTICRSLRSLCTIGDDLLDKQEVSERVLSVIKAFHNVDPSKVTADADFKGDLGLDSLDGVEIVMALEDEFKTQIPDDDADKIVSCNLAIDYMYQRWLDGQ